MALRRLPGWVVNSASIEQMVDYLLQHWSRGQQIAASNRTALTTLVETYLRGRTRQSPRDIVRLVTVPPGAQALQVDLEASAVAAILDEAAIIQQSLGLVGGTFQTAVPKAVAWAQNYALDLAQYLTTTQEQAITSALVSALNPATPLNGLQLAPLIVGSVGLTPTQTVWVMNRYRRLLAAGRSAQDAMTGATAYADRLRLQRARTIARTEINRALISGRMEAWKDAQSRGLMTGAKKRWLTAPDCCDLCLPLNGQTVGLDELFDTPWGKVDSPRFAHPNCRCNAIIESGLVNIDVLAGLVDNPDEPWMQEQDPEDVPEMVPPDGYYPAAPLLAKGEGPGHPFRGNQWTGGIRGGGPPSVDGYDAQTDPDYAPTNSGGGLYTARDSDEIYDDPSNPRSALLRLKVEAATKVAAIVQRADWDGTIPTNAPFMLPMLQSRLLPLPHDDADHPTELLDSDAIAAFTKHLNCDAAAADMMRSPAARSAALQFLLWETQSDASGQLKDADETWRPENQHDREYLACYLFADAMQRSWANSSSVKNSVALKFAVDSLSKRQGGEWTARHGDAALEARETYIDYKAAFDAYALSVYQRTQATLKKAGISEVTVDRGVVFDLAEWNALDPNVARIVSGLNWQPGDGHLIVSSPSAMRILSDPLSSWASTPAQATPFHLDVSHSSQQVGVHLTGVFPAKSVWSLAETGPGCVEETEVILGNSSGAIVTAVGHADPALPRELRARMAREGIRKDEIPTLWVDFPGLGGADWPKRTDDTWSLGISNQSDVVGKGEGPGHPFRGNQWTGGIKGGGPGSKAPPTHKRWPSEAKLRSWYGNTPEEVVASLAKMYPWAEVSGFGPDVADPVADQFNREPRKDFDMKVLLGITYAMDLCQQQFPEQARRIKHLSGSFHPAKPIYDYSTLSWYTPSDNTVAYQSAEYNADPVTETGPLPFKNAVPRTRFQIDAQINFWGMRERNPDSSGRFDPMTLLLEPHKRRWGAALPDGSQLTFDIESSARSAAHEFGHAAHSYRLREMYPEMQADNFGGIKKDDPVLRHALTYDKRVNPGFYSGVSTTELLAEEFSLGMFGTKGEGRIDPLTRKQRKSQSPYYDGIMAYLRDGDIDTAHRAVWSNDTSVRDNKSFRKSDEITTEPAECRPTAHGDICIDTFGGPQAVVKGESAGHPFRGNQWTGGIRGGGGDHLTVAPLADRIARYGSDPAQIVEHIKSMFPRLAISDAWRVTSTTREGGWPLSGASDRTRATAGGGFAFDTVPGLTKEEAVETLTAIAQAVDDMSALFPEITYDINKIFIGSGSHGGDVGAHVDGMGMRLDPYRARDYIHNAETIGVGIPHQWAGTKGTPEQLGRAMYAVVIHELAHAAHFHAEMTSGDVAGLEDGTITAGEQIRGKTKSGKRRPNQRSDAMVKFHEEAFWTLSQDSVPGNKGWLNWDDSPSGYARTDEGEWVAEVVTAHLLGVTPNSPNAKKIMTWLKDQQRKYRIKWSDMDWSKFMTRDPMTPSGDLAVVAKGSGDFVDDFDGSVIWRWVLGDDAVTKGEGPGHPFRGNQYTGGIKGGGSALGTLPSFAGADLGAKASHNIDTQDGEGTRAHDAIQEAGALSAAKAAADIWTHDTFPKVLADAAVLYSPLTAYVRRADNEPRMAPVGSKMQAAYLKHYAAATTAITMAQNPATRVLALEMFERQCAPASTQRPAITSGGVTPSPDELPTTRLFANGVNPLAFHNPDLHSDLRTDSERYDDAMNVYRQLGISGSNHAEDRALVACYFFACEMQNTWARSSTSMGSYALKHAVADLSGTVLHHWATGFTLGGFPGPDQFVNGGRLYSEYRGLFQAYVRTVHANTQRLLRESGLGPTIPAYRGVSVTENNAGAMAAARQIVASSGGFGAHRPKTPWVRTTRQIAYTPFTKATVLADSLSAWATDEHETKDFASIDGEEGASAGIGFRMEAPLQAVWSTPVTGPGCFDEAEAIMLNTDKATVLGRVIAYQHYADVFSKTDEPEIPEIYIDFPGLGGADWPKRTDDTGDENESR